jgi:UTP--glucose-1-phosphate uridylyltransferase
VPKALIPVFDRPPVHYVVEEAVRAGIGRIVFVISPGQEAVGGYFDSAQELERALEQKGHGALLEQMREISEMADVLYVCQEEPRGLGHAVLTSREAIGDEPFAVFLPDDFIWSETPTIGGMLEVFGQRQGSVVAVKEVPDEVVPSLGIIEPEPLDETVSRVLRMVEKPSLEEAPSNLAIIGRYVLTAEVFDALEEVRPGALGEIQLTDAIAMLLPAQPVFAFRFPGDHFDVGTPLGLLKASVFAALQREDVSDELRAWLGSGL